MAGKTNLMTETVKELKKEFGAENIKIAIDMIINSGKENVSNVTIIPEGTPENFKPIFEKMFECTKYISTTFSSEEIINIIKIIK